MSLIAYTIKSIVENVDPESGEISFRANVVEYLPRVARLNLQKSSASFINELQHFVGKTVALDVREGVTSSGFAFTTLVNENLLPVDVDYLTRKHQQELSFTTVVDEPLPEHPSSSDKPVDQLESKKPLFGKAANA